MRFFSTPTALLALVALIGAGCDRQSPPSSTTEPTPSPEVQPTPSAGPLHLYFRHGSLPRAIIERFARESGIAVEIETYATNEQMLANLLSGRDRPDLIEPAEYVVEDLIQDHLLLPLNHAALPNLKHLDPRFLNLPFDPENRFTVPYRADTVGIVINTERVKEKIRGYEDVFSGTHRNRIVVLDNAREIVSWVFATLDLPVNEVTETHLEQAQPVLARWLRQVKAYDSDHPESLLESGGADLGIVRSDAAARLLEADKKFRWVVPREGSHLTVDSLAIPRTADHVEAALAFLNFLLRPDISAEISRTDHRINPNTAAREILAAESNPLPTDFPAADAFPRLHTHRGIGDQSLRLEEMVNGLKTP